MSVVPKDGRSKLREADMELRRPVRRVLVLVTLLGYPLFVAAWLGLPAAGVTGLAWALVVAAIGFAVIVGAATLYVFRRSMAQAPDAQLDERQVRIRDRAFLVAYQVFAGLTLLGLLVVGIGSDAIDRPITLTYDTMQPLVWGVILYGIILPSAIVAWQEPDLDREE
jgi:uncharacterized membrane protein